MNKIQKRLFELQDKAYGDFTAKLIPNVDRKTIIGVRTPEVRKYAKELGTGKEAEAFLNRLPHKYLEENGLHCALIGQIKDFDKCMDEVEKFLPYVDNWGTCDGLSPKVFGENKKELLKHIKVWLKSDLTYTKRFAIGMLMEHYLDDDFDVKYPGMVSKIRSEEYYVNMMIAWYFATALAKQYDAVIPFIKEEKLDKWTHNKTIQKAIESYRVTDEQKAELRSYKRK